MKNMETEIGTVIETHSGRARVEVSQSGLCEHCEMSSSCMSGVGTSRTIDVADPVGVSTGQRVRIELGSRELIGASLLAYLVPLIGMFIGAFLGFYLVDPASRELWAGVGAIIGLAGGFMISRIAAAGAAMRGKLTPVITAIVPDENMEKQKSEN
jgi:sigma-E factor negative regulatory protein RseC